MGTAALSIKGMQVKWQSADISKAVKSLRVMVSNQSVGGKDKDHVTPARPCHGTQIYEGH